LKKEGKTMLTLDDLRFDELKEGVQPPAGGAAHNVKSGNSCCVSLYMSVDPVADDKGGAAIHLKNMIKSVRAGYGRDVLRAVKEDLARIESFFKTERRAYSWSTWARSGSSDG
jgi:hypothetical protein